MEETVEQVVEPAEEIEEIEESIPSEEVEEIAEEIEDDTPAEQPKGVQKRINEITRARYEEQRRADAAETRAKELEAKLDSFYTKPDAVSTEKAPKEDDFETYEEFVKATVHHEIDIKNKAAKQEADRQAKEAEKLTKQHTFQSSVNSLMQKGSSLYADYDEVVRGMPILTNETLSAALETEKGAEILYYLGTHLDEAARIGGLTPFAQAIEIGKLEVRLKPKPKTPTKAPDPISPLGTAGSDITVDLSNPKLDDIKWEKEFRARRQKIKGY